MEGGQAQQAHTPAASARWLQFAQWLQQQRGVPLDEAHSEASTSDVEEADLPADPATTPAAPGTSLATSSSSTGGRSGVAPAAPAARTAATSAAAPGAGPVAPSQLARHTALGPRLPDCRAEMRLTSESSTRARQEMTVMLAAPGMPLHEAPVLTAKQASALMSAICEPLLSLPVGRLTRKLSAPTRLQPTTDRGVLSLWLLPDDSLSLVWQSTTQMGPLPLSEDSPCRGSGACSTDTSSSSSHSISDDAAEANPEAGGTSSSSSASSSSGTGAAPVAPQRQQACSVAVWEELAHFPAFAHLLDDAPVVTIHMLRGDASGRSFYIRVRDDVAEANLEAATAAVPEASRLLQQRSAALAAGANGSAGSYGASAAAAEADKAGAPRMYFWLTERDLSKAVYSLGRLKSLLKRPPTLSKRSGVPERQLQHLAAWMHQADLRAAQQQRQAAVAQQAELQEAAAAEAGEGQGGTEDSTAVPPLAASADAPQPADSAPGSGAHTAPHLPLLPGTSAGLLLGQHGMPAAASQLQGSMSALLPAACPNNGMAGPAGPAAPAAADAEGGPAVACASSTVSATAAALYQDHRFNVVCPCTISVVVSMKLQGAGADPAQLSSEASQQARSVAEAQAKSAVDRSGRQRIEERLAEIVIRNIRAQRNRARQARQQQRDSAARQAAAARALALARQATGRAPPAPPPPAAEAAPGAALSAAAPTLVSMPLRPPIYRNSSASDNELVAATDSRATACSPSRASCDDGARAFAASPAVPSPAVLPPTRGRVTLDNLHSLLTPQGLDAGSGSSSQGGCSADGAVELGTAAGGPDCPRAGSSGNKITLDNLAELLNKQKLD